LAGPMCGRWRENGSASEESTKKGSYVQARAKEIQ
jgi:hypothetical protein